MSVQLLPDPDYHGLPGLALLRDLQVDMLNALADQNWSRLQQLDVSAGILIDKVIEANRHTQMRALIDVLTELKSVYACLLRQCQHKATSLAV
jgi:hypothetical protein